MKFCQFSMIPCEGVNRSSGMRWWWMIAVKDWVSPWSCIISWESLRTTAYIMIISTCIGMCWSIMCYQIGNLLQGWTGWTFILSAFVHVTKKWSMFALPIKYVMYSIDLIFMAMNQWWDYLHLRHWITILQHYFV